MFAVRADVFLQELQKNIYLSLLSFSRYTLHAFDSPLQHIYIIIPKCNKPRPQSEAQNALNWSYRLKGSFEYIYKFSTIILSVNRSHYGKNKEADLVSSSSTTLQLLFFPLVCFPLQYLIKRIFGKGAFLTWGIPQWSLISVAHKFPLEMYIV